MSTSSSASTSSSERPANDDYGEIKKWDDLDISPELLRGIFSNGFETPSPIQKRAILPIIAGRDVIAQAQSGTGKTGAFTISALRRISLEENYPQVLLLSPTRELTEQIYDVISMIGSFMEGLRVMKLYGGTSVDDDVYALKAEDSQPHIIVGCPGRVHDMLNRGALRSSKLRLMIVDEADEMLSSGFKDQLYNLFQFMPQDVQVAIFSATLSQEVLNITDKFMREPVRILVKTEMLSLEGISQYFIALADDKMKYDTLKDLYKSLSVSQCIIYCNSVKRVSDLYNSMMKENYPVCSIHSGMTKEEREKSIKDFKLGVFRVMISSDLTARGIDVQQVSMVVNFDIPKDVATYLHRIGRSGRFGRKGVGINFMTKRDIRNMKNIEQHYQTEIQELPSSFMV